jgi:hypothetical protein
MSAIPARGVSVTDEIDYLGEGEVIELWGDADVDIQRLVAGVWMTFSRVSKPSSTEPLCLTGQEGTRYVVIESFGGGGILRLRLDQTDEDRARNFNRTEYVSVIPESDKDFAALHGLRQDAESINQGITDGITLAGPTRWVI